MSGWIALHRGWRDNDVFGDEPMTEREAWVWLIEAAAWKSTIRRNAKGERIAVGRGQYHTSLRSLGAAFGWGKNKVDRYLERLVSAGMIGTVSGQSGLLLTVCNYDKYQSVITEEEAARGTAAGQPRDTQEQGKQESSPSGEGVPPVDTVKAIWDIGIALLTASGRSRRDAGSLIGRWRRDHGDGPTLAALVDCQAKNISEPVEWISKRWSHAAQAGGLSDLAAQAERYRHRRAA